MKHAKALKAEFQAGIRQIVNRSSGADAAVAARASVPLEVFEISAIRVVGDRGLVRMSDLSSVLKIPASTATMLADRLVAKRVFMRERNEADRRIVNLSLTRIGKSLYRESTDQHLRLCEEMLAVFDIREQKLLLALMSRLAAPPKQTATGVKPARSKPRALRRRAS